MNPHEDDEVPSRQAQENLDHIVVLMMENQSAKFCCTK
jgi:hypothetical protein